MSDSLILVKCREFFCFVTTNQVFLIHFTIFRYVLLNDPVYEIKRNSACNSLWNEQHTRRSHTYHNSKTCIPYK